jgi:hypothetical protein
MQAWCSTRAELSHVKASKHVRQKAQRPEGFAVLVEVQVFAPDTSWHPREGAAINAALSGT